MVIDVDHEGGALQYFFRERRSGHVWGVQDKGGAAEDIRWSFQEHAVGRSEETERIRHVVQSAFNGRRIVIFSGGAAKGRDGLIEEIRGIADGGGFGSIIGRNSFQRPKTEAVDLLHEVMDIYANA